jgi:hypothetical protein
MRVCVAALSTYKLDRDRLVLLRVEAWFQRRKKKRPLARQWQHGAGCHAPPWCGTFVDDAKAALANLAEDLVLFAHHLQRRRAPRRRARRIRAPPRRLHRRRLHRTHRPRALRHGPASPRSTKARHSTARTHAGSGADRGRFQSIEDSTALTLGYVTNVCGPLHDVLAGRRVRLSLRPRRGPGLCAGAKCWCVFFYHYYYCCCWSGGQHPWFVRRRRPTLPAASPPRR